MGKITPAPFVTIGVHVCTTLFAKVPIERIASAIPPTIGISAITDFKKLINAAPTDLPKLPPRVLNMSFNLSVIFLIWSSAISNVVNNETT